MLTRDFGDFQTPPELVTAILKTLHPVGSQWPRVLEPTCGRGNFIAGLLALESPPKEIQALEKQASYVHEASRLTGAGSGIHTCIRTGDIFQTDLRTDVHWIVSGRLLVLGNPPWVTNAELGSLESTNLPHKINKRRVRGIDALTGESNFDLAEYVWIKVLTELAAEQPTIAMLCKMSVAANVLRFIHEHAIPVTEASVRKIDARKWFHATVEACLLTVKVGSTRMPFDTLVYSDLTAARPASAACIRRGALVWDRQRYDRSSLIDGSCSLSWRQGIKHDAAKVVELTEIAGTSQNQLGETVRVEADYVYPLLKGSDLFNGNCDAPRFSVIVTQTHLRDNTEELRKKAPALWTYLTSHQDFFAKRKSSVYAHRVPFSMFGVGDYAFADFKVAIAGFYRSPRFRALGPFHGRPVILDDTCYFVECDSAKQAALLASLLNDPICLDFLTSVIFPGAKRPVTKNILQRIDLLKLWDLAPLHSLLPRFEAERERLGNLHESQPPATRDALQALLRLHKP